MNGLREPVENRKHQVPGLRRYCRCLFRVPACSRRRRSGPQIRMGDIMGAKKSAVKGHEEKWEFEEADLPDEECQDRTLVLGKVPRPRKVMLIAAGVKEIRCICCARIRPIAGAEELGEGWICGDCLSEAKQERKCG